MSLHCPATLLVARHGEADYARPGVLSDEGGQLSPVGRAQVADLARAVADERVAAVYCSSMSRAEESADIVAEALDVCWEPDPALVEVRVGSCAGRPVGDPSFQRPFDAWLVGDLDARIPGGESGLEVVARLREVLLGIADQHRGEQVVVIAHGGLLAVGLPALAGNVPADLAVGAPLPNATPVRLEIGDHGWRLGAWPGAAAHLAS